jgi:hypothetical protein
MVVKKFTYEDGMNLLVPAKCGTRWVDGNTNPKSIINKIHHTEIITIKNLVDSKTKMIFRNPHDAFISGLHTEYVWSNFTIEELIDNFWENKHSHCSFDFWEHIYELWDNDPFEFVMQSDLSELFKKKKSDLNTSLYDSHQMERYITKDKLKEKIGIAELKKMYDVIDEDAMWLERMIKNERGLISKRIFDKAILEKENIISDLKLKMHDEKLEKENIISDLKLKISKMSQSETNNKNEILKSIKILSNILQETNRLI